MAKDAKLDTIDPGSSLVPLKSCLQPARGIVVMKRRGATRAVTVARNVSVRRVVMPVFDRGFGDVLPFVRGGPIHGCSCHRTRSNAIILETSDQPVRVNGQVVQPHTRNRIPSGASVVIGGRQGELRLELVEISGPERP
ncbi:MAG: hypothetical protein WC497_06130 [Patescibacteria group bacterium]